MGRAGLIVFAVCVALMPTRADAVGAFGLELTGGGSAWLLAHRFEFRVDDGNLNRVQRGEFQREGEWIVHVALAPGVHYDRGFLFFPIGYYHHAGEIRAPGKIDPRTLQAVRAPSTWDSWDEFRMQMCRFGAGGGLSLPKKSRLRIVPRLILEGYAGTLRIERFDTATGVGVGGAFDLALRYYFGRPLAEGRPTGFFIALGGETRVQALWFFQKTRKIEREETSRAWPTGFLLQAGYGF